MSLTTYDEEPEAQRCKCLPRVAREQYGATHVTAQGGLAVRTTNNPAPVTESDLDLRLLALTSWAMVVTSASVHTGKCVTPIQTTPPGQHADDTAEAGPGCSCLELACSRDMGSVSQLLQDKPSKIWWLTSIDSHSRGSVGHAQFG